MSFPPAFLQELRDRLPLSEVIGRATKVTRAGREWKALCPFHQERTPSFTLNDSKGFYHCFGCGAHGDVIGFVMRQQNLSFPDAVAMLAQQAGLPIPQPSPTDQVRYSREQQHLKLMEDATHWFAAQLTTASGQPAREYLRQRSLSDETIAAFRLGFAPADGNALPRAMVDLGHGPELLLAMQLVRKDDQGRLYSFFRDRVIFPITDRRGRPIAFGGRLLDSGEPKYINSPETDLFQKGRTLFNLSRARANARQEPLLVVEGYMDVITLAQAGIGGALAPLGTALTELHLQEIWRAQAGGPDPILCFDGDNAGRRAAGRALDRLLPLLAPERTVRIAFLPDGQDPDSMVRQQGAAAFRAILAQAVPVVDVLWQGLLGGRALQTPEERASLQKAVEQAVRQINDPSLQQFYRQELRQRFDALFRPPPMPRAPFPPATRIYRTGQRPGPPLPERPIARQRPAPAAVKMESMICATLLNHISLLHEFIEYLSQDEFKNPDYERLRQHLVGMGLEQPEYLQGLDACALKRHFSDSGFGDMVAGLLTEQVYLHAGFARPERAIAEARQGLRELWDAYRRPLLSAEVGRVVTEMKQDPSAQNLTRMENLLEMARDGRRQEQD